MRWAKPPLFLLCLAPLMWLGWRAWNQDLGANPIDLITDTTGQWTLRFVAITLAVTPLRRLSGVSQLIRLRRMLGLFAFFYGCLHFLTYVWLDQFFDIASMVHDVGKRPFITAGFTAFVLMVPLALTSTAGWIRRLGGRRWQFLHRAIYATATAGVLHYWWLVKSDIRGPLAYTAVVGLLLAYRALHWYGKRRAGSRRLAPADADTPEEQAAALKS